MSDMSPGSTDPTPTAPYDPAPYTPTPPVVGPAAGTNPVPSPTPPASTSSTWRDRRDYSGRTGTIVFGVILVAVGLWFFADQTLGLDMPRLRWSELWPLLIIGIGGWIVLGSIRRG